MKVAIHQPHYFPWLGYMDKMAKADKFVILNEVQLEKGSNMYRNKMLTWDGKEKYLTVCYKKKGCLEKKFQNVLLDNTVDWQDRQKGFLFNNYKKARYFDEVWQEVSDIFEGEYDYLYDVDLASIMALRNLLDVQTPLVFQNELKYDTTKKNNDLVLELCKCLGADYYLSGNGARKYMQIETFKKENIIVKYQNFTHPEYTQLYKEEFHPCMSALDLLFNNGIKQSREIFWNNVKKGKEFEGEER